MLLLFRGFGSFFIFTMMFILEKEKLQLINFIYFRILFSYVYGLGYIGINCQFIILVTRRYISLSLTRIYLSLQHDIVLMNCQFIILVRDIYLSLTRIYLSLQHDMVLMVTKSVTYFTWSSLVVSVLPIVLYIWYIFFIILTY